MNAGDVNAGDNDSLCQYIYWQVKFPFPLSNRDVSLHNYKFSSLLSTYGHSSSNSVKLSHKVEVIIVIIVK